MDDVFRQEVSDALDEIGDSLFSILEHVRDRQETDASDDPNRLVATLKLASAHVGSAAAILPCKEGDGLHVSLPTGPFHPA